MTPNDLNKMFQGHAAPSSPHPRDYLKRPSQQRHGTTIGDGILASARIAAVTTMITLIVKSGPMLIVGLGGVLICLWSYMAPRPTLDAGRAASRVSDESPSRPSPIQVMNSSVSTSGAPAPRTRISQPTPIQSAPGQSIFEELDQQPLLVEEDNFPQLPPVPRDSRQAPGVYFEFGNPILGPNTGIRIDPQPAGPGFAFSMSPMPFAGMESGLGAGNGFMHGSAPTPNPDEAGSLSDPNDITDPARRMMEQTLAEGVAASNEDFVFKRGRKFIGTSQMPGEPSTEIRLSIVSVKDRGSNVVARLSKLNGTKFTRNYNGLIETNPLRLVLIPEAQTNGFSSFVTYSPWYSQSPTKITLSINPDKGLSGLSISGESFELEPEFTQVATREPSPAFRGFGLDSEASSEWRIRSRNGQAVQGEFWQFQSDTKTFRWKRGGEAIAEGSFHERLSENGLDLTIASTSKSRRFACRFAVAPNGSTTVQVCVPKSDGAERPKVVDASMGNVFLLERHLTGGK